MVAAQYLAAMLGETVAPGVADRIVARVALQQRDFGEPLDDLIVDFQSPNDIARLSLQLKRSLTISSASTNGDFRDIIRDCWLTLQKPGFRIDLDRFGVATETISAQKVRDLKSLCDLARASATLTDFEIRFLPSGNASAAQTVIRNDIATLLGEATGSPPSPDQLYRFLQHFVLIIFDQLLDGATDPPQVIAALMPSLAPNQVDRAPLVWDRLCRLARLGAGRAQQFIRRDLVAAIVPVARLAGKPSLRADIDTLREIARSWVLDIDDDMEGTRLARPSAEKALQDARSRYRFVQVQGLPGSGKSVLLRRQVEADLARGTAFFLKSDRLQGSSWAGFAAAIGLSPATAVTDLLVELAGVGASTLYIDGVDRIETTHRPIILDLVRSIMTMPELSGWSIVVTLRDTGVEHLRTWLPSTLFEQNVVGVVTVEQLDDDEARILADAQPALRPLLFGPRAVREIVRRPFFTKILDQNFASAQGDAGFMPKSEIDLIENWWLRGGYNAGGQSAIQRRMALLDLGAHRARDLSAPIILTDLKPETVAVIDQLLSDGILQSVRAHLSVQFAHDIFFEWAFFHHLLNAGDGWIAALAAIGEPPMIGRVVDLLSQAEFARNAGWSTMLRRVQESGLRSQWTRAWLLAPLSSPGFDELEDRFLATVTAEDSRLLQRVLVWFQAERTIPNPSVLKGERGNSEMSLEARIRAADLLGWPSDFPTWGRLIALLLRRLDQLPAHLVPHIAAIFEVWQNALSDIENPVSKALLTQSYQWLCSLDDRWAATVPRWGSTADKEAVDPWQDLRGSKKELASDLRRLVLRSARAEPALVEAYCKRLLSQEELLGQVIDEIFGWSLLLAQTHPSALVDLTLLHMRQELPADAAARMEREDEAASEQRAAARAKPESERSRDEQMAADGLFSRLGMNSYSFSDWDDLALDSHRPSFFPASPLRDPFKSLFDHAPSEALRLLSALSNHAMTAWRQLHELDWQRRATTIPLDLQFPWGQQRFWGTTREYLWSRGIWAPKPLACAYLTAENWALGELEKGGDPDALIRQILAGNECIASLALVLVVARQANCVSDTVQPLIESARIWQADVRRGREEIGFRSTLLIGFMEEKDRPHAEAVDAINKRPIRDSDICSFAASSMLIGDHARIDRTRAAILDFARTLPFEYEEQRENPDVQRSLAEFASSMAHWANPQNYQAVRNDEHGGIEAVYYVNPEAATPEGQERRASAHAFLSRQALYVWAEKSLELGKIDSSFSYPDALALAHHIEQDTTAPDAVMDPHSAGSGGVAGTAAIALMFRDLSSIEDRVWARQILGRVVQAPEPDDPTWSSMSVIRWHPGIFAARGLAADIRGGEAGRMAARDLLKLATHPLDCVAHAAFGALLGLFDISPRLAWSGLCLGFALCVMPLRGTQMRSPQDYARADAARRTAALKNAINIFKSRRGWPIPPVPEAPWTFVADAPPPRRHGFRRPQPQVLASDDEIVEGGAWRPSAAKWNSQLAAKIIQQVPVTVVLQTPGASEALLAFARAMLAWTIESIAPHWDPDGRDTDRRTAELFEWRRAFARHLGRMAGLLNPAVVESDILVPIVAMRADPCFSLLAPLVDHFLCVHLLDAPVAAPSTDRVLAIALERLLAWRGFEREGYRAGELNGHDLPDLVKALLFVAVLDASGATRFANGDWRDIGLILPTVDRFVRAAGWSPTVMSKFLTLCEHARVEYPAPAFAAQVLSVLSMSEKELARWHGTMMAPRIASLVQFFADRETPMPNSLSEPLLCILDTLVDQGDRRSAALQVSVAFRAVKLADGSMQRN